jgi:predicted PurR-regulated permease PerM
VSIDKVLKLPFYAKAIILFVGLFALAAVMYIGRGIIVPLLFAIIIAIVLHPVVDFFTRLRIHRLLAIAITLLLAFIVIAALGALIISQASRLFESLPFLIDRFTELLNNTITWASGYFDIDALRIHDWIAKTQDELINKSGSAIGQTLISVGSGLVLLFLIPVYVFMLLFYQPLLLEFFRRLFGKDNRSEVSEVITQIKSLIQSYLIGLLIEATIIATLYSTGLLILGIEYAIIIGIIGALLNLIPYLGAIIAASLPMMIALVTKTSPWFAMLILAMYIFIQFIDNNYIVPKIVASKVKINALFSIIVVIVGNALWGIPGMFLAIPLLAIIKLLFDHIEPLKPWGFLLGDTMPPLLKVKPIFKVRRPKLKDTSKE